MAETRQTIEFLLAQRDRWPKAQPQDLLKALHQSVFGCGHLAEDTGGGLAYLQMELADLSSRPGPELEPLDGDFCRVHLRYLEKSGLAPETLFRLFVLSSRAPAGARADLEKKLNCFLDLAQAGAFPFSYITAVEAAADWAPDYPACHHSRAFRKAYAPAYRVILQKYVPLLPLLAAIDRKLREKPQVIAALEGGSAAGKTTLAAFLAKIYDCNVFHMDDFFLRPEQRTQERYREPGGNVDRERFWTEVLLPLTRGQTAVYRPYDCQAQALGPERRVSPKALSIVEGAYSMHPDLAESYDVSAFLEISSAVQRRRILERNGAAAGERFFSRWIPLEQRYFAAMDPKRRCDFVLEMEAEP